MDSLSVTLKFVLTKVMPQTIPELIAFQACLTDRPTYQPTDQLTDRPMKGDVEAPTTELKNRKKINNKKLEPYLMFIRFLL